MYLLAYTHTNHNATVGQHLLFSDCVTTHFGAGQPLSRSVIPWIYPLTARMLPPRFFVFVVSVHAWCPVQHAMQGVSVPFLKRTLRTSSNLSRCRRKSNAMGLINCLEIGERKRSQRQGQQGRAYVCHGVRNIIRVRGPGRCLAQGYPTLRLSNKQACFGRHFLLGAAVKVFQVCP